MAQTTVQTPAITEPASNVITERADLELPDAPGSLLSSSTALSDAPADPDGAAPAQATTTTGSQPRRARHLDMVIQPGEIADPMDARTKVVAGLKDSVTLFSAAGWLGSALSAQVFNSSPNYGTNAEAFGKRLGAATVRGVSANIFSSSLFAPLFHEDPRYYIMGRGHNFFKRAIYAGTRSIITRTDSGRTTPNFSLIAGNAGSALLTIPYYPSKNTSAKEVASTFGWALGGSAFGFFVNEFIIDAMVDLHLKKQQ
jgi:hypothetical protein